MLALLVLDLSLELLDSSTGDALSLYGGLSLQVMLLNPFYILLLYNPYIGLLPLHFMVLGLWQVMASHVHPAALVNLCIQKQHM